METDASTVAAKKLNPWRGVRRWAASELARLVWVAALAVAAVIGTTFLNRAFERMQSATARLWYGRGVAALKAGQADEAVRDLQAALAHERDNRQYIQSLAQALAAAGKTGQAKAYFLNLWQGEPGNGELNLQLARLAVREHDPAQAQQYYHGAIFGVWGSDAIARRRAAREELIAFLLSQNRQREAEAELIALSGEVPGDPAVLTQVGDLFLRAGNAKRALDDFQRAVLLDPDNQPALAAAGRTAFAIGDFSRARGFLERAAHLAPEDASLQELLENVLTVEAVDPFDRRLRYAERRVRTERAFATAGRRLKACAQARGIDLSAPGSDPLHADAAQWKELKPRVTPRDLRRNPDLMETAANLALDIERHTADVCGQPSGEDLALLLIAQNRGAK
jgi:predicted Zn-dependent protease